MERGPRPAGRRWSRAAPRPSLSGRTVACAGRRGGGDESGKRGLELAMYDERPMNPRLSGLGREYRIVQLVSRDAGAREAMLWFDLAGWARRPEQPTSRWQGGALIKEWSFFNK